MNSNNKYIGRLSVILLFLVIPRIVMANDPESIRAAFSDFPSLHPLIVHFAIVLLIVGAIIQLTNIYFLKKELGWTSFALIAAGVITAYLAGRNFHPHTHGLSEQAKLVLEQHDFWADWTINLGFIGVVLQGGNLFFMTRKRWAVAIVAVVLLGSGFAVSQAGHYGAQLVHIEGVGPQGDFLESDENEHEH
jgi:uncharacterized membrane protein